MKEVTEQPKIDLAGIVVLKAYLLAQCETNAENNEAHMTPSWMNQFGVLISDGQAKQIAQALEALPIAYTVLEKIAAWCDFPETGKFWDRDEKEPMSYAAAFGTNGERDYMRKFAIEALSLFTTKTVEP